MYRAIARNKRNTWFLMIGFLALIAAIAFAINFFFGDPDTFYLPIAIMAGSLIYVIIQYFASGKEVLGIYGAREIQERDNPRLYRMVENLAITAGMPMPKVYIIEDAAPNAFATGRKPEVAAVSFTTGLLAILDDAELEGVVAHELSHIRNYDIRVATIAFGLVLVVGVLADVSARMFFFGGGRSRSDNNSGGGGAGAIIALVVSLIVIVVAPLVGGLVQAAVSRQREYLADASGAELTRYPEGLASALAKIGAYSRPMQRQVSAAAHLWMADPEGKKKRRGMSLTSMFATHPPIDERIDRLRHIGGGF